MCYYFKELGQVIFGYNGKVFESSINKKVKRHINTFEKQSEIDD